MAHFGTAELPVQVWQVGVVPLLISVPLVLDEVVDEPPVELVLEEVSKEPH